VTRREKHMTMLDMLEDFLCGEDLSPLTPHDLLDGVRFARGRAEAPAWWAEVVYELRSQRREEREDVAALD
jgi:hypothetical protein